MKKTIWLAFLLPLVGCGQDPMEEWLEEGLKMEYDNSYTGLVLCTNAIEAAARDPDRVQLDRPRPGPKGNLVPYREGYFAVYEWKGSRVARMPNALGGMERVEILCEFDTHAMQISKLVIGPHVLVDKPDLEPTAEHKARMARFYEILDSQ